MTIVVPMAGKGSRFLDAVHLNPEYKKPKPLITVKGKPMVLWAVESLPFVHLSHRPAKTKIKVTPDKLVFICRSDHHKDFKIADQLRKIFSKSIKIILLDQITRGATETVLKAKKYINTDEDILVSDSDHYFDGRFIYRKIAKKDPKTAGIIPVFVPPDNDPKWSFSLLNKKHRILAVGEKDKELAARGAHANIGGYYFSSGKLFVQEAEGMIKEEDMHGDEGKKEFYIAPLYQRLIIKGHKIVAAVTPQVWGLGTPKDVEHFEKNFVAF
jgi:NDP-sugar pyrophosphorylase family protein